MIGKDRQQMKIKDQRNPDSGKAKNERNEIQEVAEFFALFLNEAEQ